MTAPSTRRVVIGAVSAALLIAAVRPARAQGNGRGGPPFTPPGQARKGGPTSPSTPLPPATAPPVPGKRLQTFGTWLDTANVNTPGEAWMWISSSYWRSNSLREIDAPAMGVSVGVAPRVQAGVSLPYYFITDGSGFASHGFGASYLTTKLAMTRNHRVNFSASPSIEVLSWTTPGVRRVNAVLPVSAEGYAGALRLYGSTGSFSRGSVFGTGALEWTARQGLTLTSSIAHSYSVASDPSSDVLGITRHRTDATGGMYVAVRPAVVIFANVGRTFAPVNETSSRLSASVGVSMNVARRGTNVPRVP